MVSLQSSHTRQRQTRIFCCSFFITSCCAQGQWQASDASPLQAQHPSLYLVSPMILMLLPCTGYGPSASEILSLPLWDDELPSPQYSGYVVLPGTSKYMFYNLIVSEGDPATDPLVVRYSPEPWLPRLESRPMPLAASPLPKVQPIAPQLPSHTMCSLLSNTCSRLR